MKLRQIDDNTYFFEVVEGKRMYSNYVEKVCYENTVTYCGMPIPKSAITHYRVLVQGSSIFLDFNDRMDLILLTGNCGIDVRTLGTDRTNIEKVREYLENCIKVVFCRYL